MMRIMRFRNHDRQNLSLTVILSALAFAIVVLISTFAGAAGTDGRTNPTPVGALPFTDSGSTVGATSTLASSGCSLSDSKDHWYRFTPTITDAYRISLCNSGFDTTVSVFPQGSNTNIACNDDSDICGAYRSELVVDLTGGSTYDIRVAGYSGSTGNYEITVDSPFVCPPQTPDTPFPANSATAGTETVLAWNQPEAWKQKTVSASPKVIYGADDRLEQYEITDPETAAAGASTVVLVNTSQLTHNPSNDTYTLPPTPVLAERIVQGRPPCPDEPYISQPTRGHCSGSLVASDIIATAGHCVDFGNVSDKAFIFGYSMSDATTPVLTYSADQVYYGASLVGHKLVSSTGEDWALVRLDRPVDGFKVLPVRRAGKIADNLPIRVIGHPVGLPRKYAANATVQNNTPPVYYQANLDTYGGNSGSAVFDAATHLVEGVLVRGATDFVTDPGGTCYRSNVCSDTIGGTDCGGEAVTRTTQFSDLLPTFDVYLGTSATNLSLICNDITTYSCTPGNLSPGTNYFWRVSATNTCKGGTTIDSPLWSFTTDGAISGDVDNNGIVDLNDTRQTLQILSGQMPATTPDRSADVNGDNHLGHSESTYQLQQVHELRTPE